MGKASRDRELDGSQRRHRLTTPVRAAPHTLSPPSLSLQHFIKRSSSTTFTLELKQHPSSPPASLRIETLPNPKPRRSVTLPTRSHHGPAQRQRRNRRSSPSILLFAGQSKQPRTTLVHLESAIFALQRHQAARAGRHVREAAQVGRRRVARYVGHLSLGIGGVLVRIRSGELLLSYCRIAWMLRCCGLAEGAPAARCQRVEAFLCLGQHEC